MAASVHNFEFRVILHRIAEINYLLIDFLVIYCFI